MLKFLWKIFVDPVSAPLSRKQTLAHVLRQEMDREPVEDPNNWLPRRPVQPPLSRPYLWKGRP